MYDSYDPGKKWVDTMQICKNGHIINDCFIKYPESNQDYCVKCGKETITECENCNKSIPGQIHYPNVVGGFYTMTAPNYCQYCRHPFPWNKGVRKAKTGVKSGFGQLGRLIEWFAGLVEKVRKK